MLAHIFVRVRNQIFLATIIVSTVAGCAGNTNPSPSESKNAPLVVIQIEKSQQSPSSDCPVSVKIFNRMKGVDWDAASYHLAMLNKNNTSIGTLTGAPHQSTKSGSFLLDNGQVLDTPCDAITGVSVVYFGYYPTGKKQLAVHNNRVKAEIK